MSANELEQYVTHRPESYLPLEIFNRNNGQLFLNTLLPLVDQEQQKQVTLGAIWDIYSLFEGSAVRLKVPAIDLAKTGFVNEEIATRIVDREKIMNNRQIQPNVIFPKSNLLLPDPINNIVNLKLFNGKNPELIIVQQYHDIQIGKMRKDGKPSRKDYVIAELCILDQLSTGVFDIRMGKRPLIKARKDEEGQWISFNPKLDGGKLTLDPYVENDSFMQALKLNNEKGEIPFEEEPLTTTALNRTLSLVALGLHSPHITINELIKMKKRYDK